MASPSAGRTRAHALALASLVVMAGFVASRILGLVRNIVVAQQFGTGREYEAFFAAIAVPDLVFQVLAGGAIGSAFIPVFKAYVAQDDDDQAWHLTSTVMSLATLATGGAALILALFAGPLSELIVPGWDAESKQLTADLMRIMLISPALLSVSGFAISVLNSSNRFALTALAPVAYNAAIIAAAFLLQPLGIQGVAVGVAAGALLHLLVQIPGLRARGMRFRVSLDIGHAGVREVFRLMGPRMLGLGVLQLAQIVTVILASYLTVGSLGYLNLAWLLMLTPLVLAMAISTAAFPAMAEASALERVEAVREVFLLSFRTILFLTVPMAVGLVVLGEPLIRLLFERGQFTAESTRMTAYALTFYAVGLAGHAAIEIVNRVFYALHNTRTPVAVAAGAFAMNLGLSVILMRTPLDYGGLALANALAALAEGTALTVLLGRHLTGLDLRVVAGSLLRTVAASMLMGAAIANLPRFLEEQLALPPPLELSLVVGLVALAGMALYLASAYLLRAEELRTLVRLARSRG